MIRTRWLPIVLGILLALLLLLLVSVYLVEGCAPENGQTLLALTFDDGYECWTSTILPTLAQHNFVATGFINDPDTIDSFTWADVKELSDAGWEIGWHTAKHISLDLAMPDEIISDFKNLGSLFEEHGFPTPISFAYPFGKHDYSSMSIVSDYFFAARTIHTGVNTVNEVCNNPAHLAAINLDKGLSYIERLVNEYSQRGVFIVLFSHTVGEVAEWQSEPENTVSEFEDIVEFLRQKEEEGDVHVVTFSEGVSLMQQRKATRSWYFNADTPFNPWFEKNVIPIPDDHRTLYHIIMHDFLYHRYPKVANLFDRLLYGPKHVGFFLILSLIGFITILIVITVVDLSRNKMKR
jgi:peptidoglycan/xylan/chitin deacetylase (PgdA/CDA1 family)